MKISSRRMALAGLSLPWRFYCQALPFLWAKQGMPLQHTLNAVCGILLGHGMQPWPAFYCCHQGITGYRYNFCLSRQHIWWPGSRLFTVFQKR